MTFQNPKKLNFIVCISGGGQDDGNPDKIQVAGMRIKRFKGWVGGKIKGIFSKKKISAVEAQPTLMVSMIINNVLFFS